MAGKKDDWWREWGITGASVSKDHYLNKKSSVDNYKDYGFVSCYDTHPAMPIGDFVIYGGSCSSPVVKDADLYVGFDYGMRLSRRALPWVAGEEFLIHIPDMGVPKDSSDFKAAVYYVEAALKAGKKVHCGCIGGHGRTGMFLAALVCQMTGEKDAITYVRQHYCKKAVETPEQIAWLLANYGVTKVRGSKEGSRAEYSYAVKSTKKKNKAVGFSTLATSQPPSTARTFGPQYDKFSVWGD